MRGQQVPSTMDDAVIILDTHYWMRMWDGFLVGAFEAEERIAIFSKTKRARAWCHLCRAAEENKVAADGLWRE